MYPIKSFRKFALMLSLLSAIFASTSGTIRGSITDSETNDPLPGQVIVIDEYDNIVSGTAADFPFFARHSS